MNEQMLRKLEFDKILNILKDYATSEPAKALAIALRPSKNRDVVLKMLSETDEALRIIIAHGNMPFGAIYDIKEYLKLAKSKAVLNISAILKIHDTLRTVKYIRQHLIEKITEESPLYSYVERLVHLPELEKKVERTIENESKIYDDATPKLAVIRRNIEGKQAQIRRLLDNMIMSLDTQKYLQDRVITIRNDRYVLPVKAEHRGKISGIVHDQSGKGTTLYIEPTQVVSLNNEIRQLELEEEEEIYQILTELSEIIHDHVAEIQSNFKMIVLLDFIFAKGKYALEIDAMLPKIVEDRSFNLVKARHPLLPKDKVIPTDIYAGKDFSTLLITGPNTGGKTVSLKTVGVFVMMTQSGLLIPAKHGTSIAIFDEVFADIGDEQSIEQSLSTFSSHMKNIVGIIENVTENSLVLFDELGAGTDPTEGAMLAISILDHLRERGVITLATTHYAELKHYAMSTPRTENASMEFDISTLSPTYKLLIGIPGKSNAFEISKKLGLRDDIIENARRLISSETMKFEDIISKAEESRISAEKEFEKALKLRISSEELSKKLATEDERLRDKSDMIIAKAREEAKRIVKEAKEEMDEFARTLRQIKETTNLSKLDKMRSKLSSKLSGMTENVIKDDISSGNVEIEVGDTVKVLSLGQTGQVLSISQDRTSAEVIVGSLKLNTQLKKLEFISRKTRSDEVIKINRPSSTKLYISVELDVRGMNVDEAILEIDRYLADAIVSNLEKVRIIHGKGTGALRAGLHDYFRRNKEIKKFEMAQLNEGGAGATNLYLV